MPVLIHGFREDEHFVLNRDTYQSNPKKKDVFSFTASMDDVSDCLQDYESLDCVTFTPIPKMCDRVCVRAGATLSELVVKAWRNDGLATGGGGGCYWDGCNTAAEGFTCKTEDVLNGLDLLMCADDGVVVFNFDAETGYIDLMNTLCTEVVRVCSMNLEKNSNYD